MGAPNLHLGIDLGGTKIFGALVDDEGTLTEEIYVTHDQALDGPEAIPTGGVNDPAFARLCWLIARLVRAAKRAGAALAGIAVGAPGITHEGGVVAAAPTLGWSDFPLAVSLQRVFACPVQIENDVNLAALGERRFGAARGAQDVVCLSVGTGIGGAVILGGRLHRGRHHAAGEIGGFLPGREFVRWSDPHWGALESLASGSAMAMQAQLAAQAHGVVLPRPPRAEPLFAAATRGESWALPLFEQSMDYLALAVANIQALLDPEVIVLGGGVSAAAAQIIPAVMERLALALPYRPHLVASQLGYRAAVLGAVELLQS